MGRFCTHPLSESRNPLSIRFVYRYTYLYIYIYSWFVGKANRIADQNVQQDKKNPKARTGCQETTNGPDGSSSTGTLEESQKMWEIHSNMCGKSPENAEAHVAHHP